MKPKREQPGPRHAQEDGGENIAGLVYGVAIRGRLPASFRQYLLPAADGAEAADSLEVSYRRIEELPEVEAMWESREEAPGDTSDSGRFTLFRQDAGFGLLVSDQGSGLFHCERRTIRISWTEGGTGAPHYFFSYALPLWLEFRGVPVLHGSAVLIRDRAVGFVGPSGAGKSVLAADLARLGCRLIADDALVLRRDGGGAWRAFCGPPLLRLWPSALRLLEITAHNLPAVHETLDKRQLSLQSESGGTRGGSTDDCPNADAGVRLAALYVLERRSAAGSPVEISRMPLPEALFQLIEHGVATAPAAALGLSAQRFQLLADFVENIQVRRLRLPSGAGSTTRVREAILADLESSD